MKIFLKGISSLLIGLSISFYYWIGSFVLSQSKSALRGLNIDPSNLKIYIPLGIVIGAIIFWITKKAIKSFLILAVILFVLSLAMWWLVSSPSIQQHILPPILK
jgi:hypothetical protein